MEKVYVQWQYDPQKAQLEHKAQVCAKFAHSGPEMKAWRPPAGQTSFFPTNYNTLEQFLPWVKTHRPSYPVTVGNSFSH